MQVKLDFLCNKNLGRVQKYCIKNCAKKVHALSAKGFLCLRRRISQSACPFTILQVSSKPEASPTGSFGNGGYIYVDIEFSSKTSSFPVKTTFP